MGHPRGSHPRASRAAEPRADAASPGHPGVRAGADRRQGDPAASAGVHGVQRRLRRRPDGGARAAVAGSAARSARADDVVEQHPVAGQRRSDHRAVAGRRARSVLHDPRARECEGRGHGVLGRAGSAPRLRDPRRGSAGEGESPHRRAREAGRRQPQGDHPRRRHDGRPLRCCRRSCRRACRSTRSTAT